MAGGVQLVNSVRTRSTSEVVMASCKFVMRWIFRLRLEQARRPPCGPPQHPQRSGYINTCVPAGRGASVESPDINTKPTSPQPMTADQN